MYRQKKYKNMKTMKQRINIEIEKYGKTCQPNQKRNPDINPRPQCQVQRFSRELAKEVMSQKCW